MSTTHRRPPTRRRAARAARQLAAWPLWPFALLYVWLRTPAPLGPCLTHWAGRSTHEHACTGRPGHPLPHVCACRARIPAPPKVLIRVEPRWPVCGELGPTILGDPACSFYPGHLPGHSWQEPCPSSAGPGSGRVPAPAPAAAL